MEKWYFKLRGQRSSILNWEVREVLWGDIWATGWMTWVQSCKTWGRFTVSLGREIAGLTQRYPWHMWGRDKDHYGWRPVGGIRMRQEEFRVTVNHTMEWTWGFLFWVLWEAELKSWPSQLLALSGLQPCSHLPCRLSLVSLLSVPQLEDSSPPESLLLPLPRRLFFLLGTNPLPWSTLQILFLRTPKWSLTVGSLDHTTLISVCNYDYVNI